MIIPGSGNSFNQILAEALERAKNEEKKPEKEEYMAEKIVQIVGKYIADHADELYAVEYTDLMGDDIRIHLRRRRKGQ